MCDIHIIFNRYLEANLLIIRGFYGGNMCKLFVFLMKQLMYFGCGVFLSYLPVSFDFIAPALNTTKHLQ